MYIPRLLSKRLLTLADYFPSLIISGARQTGKTTLLKHTFPEFSYVSLDLPSKAEQAERNPADFLAEHTAPLIIDEVQYAPGLFRHLKTEIDKNRHEMGRYILTGSQDFSLMKHVSDSLAGRCVMLQLEDLSSAELRQVNLTDENKGGYLELMTRGQFPELWRLPDFPSNDFYASYLATYLERDVRQVLNVTSLRDFERFIRITASRSGNMLNKTDIARDVGLSVKAVGDWISVLEASGQIVLLEPWFTNFDKRIVKSPKLYFRDTGLLCFLLGLDKKSLTGSAFLGAVWETFIFSELRKINNSLDKPVNIWYYRDQRAREIDFLIETGGTISFMECKWKETPDISDAQTVRTLSIELAESGSQWLPGHHYIAAPSSAGFSLTEDITVVPLFRLDDLLSGTN